MFFSANWGIFATYHLLGEPETTIDLLVYHGPLLSHLLGVAPSTFTTVYFKCSTMYTLQHTCTTCSRDYVLKKICPAGIVRCRIISLEVERLFIEWIFRTKKHIILVGIYFINDSRVVGLTSRDLMFAKIWRGPLHPCVFPQPTIPRIHF